MTPLRIGLVGYGGFGRFLHETWEADGRARVVAVSALDGGPGGVPVHTDWRDLVARDDVDLVAVATPPASHAEIGRAALAAGRHLLIEKPIATTLADADALIAARDRSGRVAGVDFMLRFTPIVEALVAWSASGAFGPLVRVALENEAQDATLPAGHWFWDRALSGGILVEHAVHVLDLVNALVEAGGGDVRASEIGGHARLRADGREDRVLATVGHPGGPLSTHAHAFTRPVAFERTAMRVTFARAEVDLDGWVPLAGSVRALVSGPDAEAELGRLPGLTETRREALPDGPDLVEATFALPTPKPEAYAAALRALLADVHRATLDPAHRLRVDLEAGREALRQALAARDAADRHAGT